MLAATSNAIIVGFNVRPDAAAQDERRPRATWICACTASSTTAIDEIEAAMKGMLAPKFQEVVLGRAEVRQVYKITGVGTVAGCYVLDGKMQPRLPRCAWCATAS